MNEVSRRNPTHLYGQGAALQERMGIDLVRGELIAAIVVFAANTEYHLERAIWHLRGGVEPGLRPDTDGKSITDLIDMLDATAEVLDGEERRGLVQLWCVAAHSGFTIRNNIAHGVTGKMGGSVVFLRNAAWGGVVRKRPFGDLWADVDTLTMIRDSFACLLRFIHGLSGGAAAGELAARALREARSILGEFASQSYNPSFEKY